MAALRGLTLVTPVLVVAALVQGEVRPATVLVTLAAALLAVPMWLVELRGAARAQNEDPGEPFVVWILGGAAAVLWSIQAQYVSAVLETGSLDQGVRTTFRLVSRMGDNVLSVIVLYLVAGCPFALAAHVRLRGFEPRSTLFVTAYALLVPAVCMACAAVPVIAVSIVLLLWAYALADWLHDRLWAGVARAEREAFAPVAERLTRSQLWLLAYLDHPAARDALGARAPDAPADLEAFVLGLEPAGRMAAVRCAAAAAQLAVPFLEERRRDDPAPRALLRALEGWLDDPTDPRRAEVRALLDAWPARDDPDPAARALTHAVQALEGEQPWAARLALRAAARGAKHAAAVMQDPAGVREAIRAALTGWVLSEAPPAPPASPAPPGPPP